MRILIVDDDYISRTKLKALLRPYGDCDAIHNGALALEMFEQAWKDHAPYDLITMDVDMPDFRGQHIVQRIRDWEQDWQSYKQDKEARILMVSGLDDPQSIVGAFRTGCEAYVVKPIKREELEKTLASIGVPIPAATA
jgi:two-component system chemotaxis response regulator CheY